MTEANARDGGPRRPEDAFRVGPLRDAVEAGFARGRGLAWRLSALETRFHREALREIPIAAPIYVTGLARAGTTMLLEALAAGGSTVSHSYRDYPGLRTPLFWKRFVDLAARPGGAPTERAHQDGVMVTPDSPEAFEEVLWMDYFAGLHDPARSNRLDRDTSNPAFEAAYRDHIRKLLLAYGGTRYLAKGNYNVARLAYIHALFPDARFVLCVRDPLGHIGSLMRQHRKFVAGQRRHPRARNHLRRIGHFEFGLDRRPINFGDAAEVEAIRALWASGQEVRGWARYWSSVYRHVATSLDADPALRAATLIVDYDEICGWPSESLTRVAEHAGLAGDSAMLASAEGIAARNYYDPGFGAADIAAVAEETSDTVARLARFLPAFERHASAA